MKKVNNKDDVDIIISNIEKYEDLPDIDED
jgi:hypothetical protein